MRRTLAPLVLGSFVVMAGALPAAAQDGGLGGGLMSFLGLTAPEAPAIDYRERPPLVVPPRSTLPSPQEREAARARANWPNDPDLQRRRAAQADALTPATERERYRINQGGQLLSNEELARGRGAQGTVPRPNNEDQFDLMHGPMRQMREADARYFARAKESEVPIGQEPPRRYLFEPPTGYRTATQRVAPGPRDPVTRSDSTGQREFLTGRPVPN